MELLLRSLLDIHFFLELDTVVHLQLALKIFQYLYHLNFQAFVILSSWLTLVVGSSKFDKINFLIGCDTKLLNTDGTAPSRNNNL